MADSATELRSYMNTIIVQVMTARFTEETHWFQLMELLATEFDRGAEVVRDEMEQARARGGVLMPR